MHRHVRTRPAFVALLIAVICAQEVCSNVTYHKPGPPAGERGRSSNSGTTDDREQANRIDEDLVDIEDALADGVEDQDRVNTTLTEGGSDGWTPSLPQCAQRLCDDARQAAAVQPQLPPSPWPPYVYGERHAPAQRARAGPGAAAGAQALTCCC